MNIPQQVLKANIETGVRRAQMPSIKMVFSGILAGMFIAGGAAASSVVMHGISNVGLARFAGGVIFPVGLMMIVFVGGELFTGDCLMFMGVLDGKVKILDMLRVWVVVFAANLIGAVFFAALVNASGQYQYTDGLLGAYTIKVALGKVCMPFGAAVVSGILCNIFVCIAVLMAGAAKSAAGKICAIFFPIMAFVVSGYEHCVANMYYIPAGILALGNETYVKAAIGQYGYTAGELMELNWGSFLVGNLLPVTLGNIIGGGFFVGAALYYAKKEL